MYSSSLLNIDYLEKEQLVLSTWTGNPLNAESFVQEMKYYMEKLRNAPTNKVIWDHSHFNFHIPDALYPWIENEVNLPAKAMGMKKIGFVLGKDVMAQFSTMDSFEATNSVFAPRYFSERNKAIRWISHKEPETFNPFEKEISFLIEKNATEGTARIQIELSLEQLPFYLKRLKEMFNHQALVHQNFKKFMSLTLREKEILQLITEGCSNKTIAAQLFTSIHTISTHRKNIMRKLECRNMAGLVRYKLFLQV